MRSKRTHEEVPGWLIYLQCAALIGVSAALFMSKTAHASDQVCIDAAAAVKEAGGDPTALIVQPVDMTNHRIRFCTPAGKAHLDSDGNPIPMVGKVKCLAFVGDVFAIGAEDVPVPLFEHEIHLPRGQFWGKQEVTLRCQDDDGVGVATRFTADFPNGPAAPIMLGNPAS